VVGLILVFGPVGAAIIGIGAACGITFEDVKNFIVHAMEIGAFTISNFGMACQLTWQFIKFGALREWDAISNGIEVVWVVIKGGAMAFAATVGSLFVSLGNNALAVAGAIRTAWQGLFSALGAGWRAVLSGSNPLEAFRDAMRNSLTEARRQLPSFDGIATDAAMAGARAAEGMQAQIRRVLSQEGGLTAAARAELERTADELGRRWGARNNGLGGRPGASSTTANPGANPEAPVTTVVVEFKTSSLADMWKQMQEGGQTRMEQLTQQSVRLQERSVTNTTDANRRLEEIRDRIQPAGPARAG
jgi:hypothetical protein